MEVLIGIPWITARPLVDRNTVAFEILKAAPGYPDIPESLSPLIIRDKVNPRSHTSSGFSRIRGVVDVEIAKVKVAIRPRRRWIPPGQHADTFSAQFKVFHLHELRVAEVDGPGFSLGLDNRAVGAFSKAADNHGIAFRSSTRGEVEATRKCLTTLQQQAVSGHEIVFTGPGQGGPSLIDGRSGVGIAAPGRIQIIVGGRQLNQERQHQAES